MSDIMAEDSRVLDARYYMPAFSRTMKIVRGAGSRVWDDQGREYIDCVAGIASAAPATATRWSSRRSAIRPTS